MYWHAELTMRLDKLVRPGKWLMARHYTVRGYQVPNGYDLHMPFDAVAQADLDLADRTAFVHGAKTEPDLRLSVKSWRDLARYLRDEHGVLLLLADRHGQDMEYETARA